MRLWSPFNMTKWTKLIVCLSAYGCQLLFSRRSSGSNAVPFSQFCDFPMQTTPTGLKGASKVVLLFVWLVWFHLVLCRLSWTVELECPFCLSEFCLQTGMPLHLALLFAIHQGRESNGNQGLFFTELTCFFLSQYFPIPPLTHLCLISQVYPIYIISLLPVFPEPLLCPSYCLISNSWPSFL